MVRRAHSELQSTVDLSSTDIEDFMLCKAENRDPEHCLKEGRRVTRCAADL